MTCSLSTHIHTHTHTHKHPLQPAECIIQLLKNTKKLLNKKWKFCTMPVQSQPTFCCSTWDSFCPNRESDCANFCNALRNSNVKVTADVSILLLKSFLTKICEYHHDIYKIILPKKKKTSKGVHKHAFFCEPSI